MADPRVLGMLDLIEHQLKRIADSLDSIDISLGRKRVVIGAQELEAEAESIITKEE
jgi:hypothetical protein